MVPEMSTLTSADQLIDPEMDTSAITITEVSDPHVAKCVCYTLIFYKC